MKRNNNSKAPKQNSPWGQIRLGSFKAEFPQPRLPRILGADRHLGVGTSVYPVVKLDVPIIQQNLSIAAGALASVVPIDTTVIQNWVSRFQTLFREYAICGARLEIRMNNVVINSGLVCAYLDEQTSGAPTAAEAEGRGRLDILCAQQFQPGSYTIDWKPRDILDLDYTNVGTVFTPVWLKLFASNAATGTQATTTGQVVITGTVAFTFRGYL